MNNSEIDDIKNTPLGKLALESEAIAGLLEDLGYGPWRAAHRETREGERINE